MAPESGAKKRRSKEELKLIESQRGSLHKFSKSTNTSRNPDELALVLVGEQSNVDLDSRR